MLGSNSTLEHMQGRVIARVHVSRIEKVVEYLSTGKHSATKVVVLPKPFIISKGFLLRVEGQPLKSLSSVVSRRHLQQTQGFGSEIGVRDPQFILNYGSIVLIQCA